jgi:hypothetical protein
MTTITKTFTSYKPGQGQVALASGPLKQGDVCNWVFDTNSGVGNGKGNFFLTASSDNSTPFTGVFNGKTRVDPQDMSWQFPHDGTLELNKTYTVTATATGGDIPGGIAGKINIGGVVNRPHGTA